MRNKLNIKKSTCIIGAAFAAIAAFTLISSGQIEAQMQQAAEETAEKEQEAQSDEEALVGTYDEQMVFQQYPESQKLQEAQMKAQEQMQSAEGDEQKTQEIQQEFYQEQQKIVEEFQDAVEDALPEVAENAEVKAIAVQVSYTAEGIGTKDVTSEVVEAIGGDPEEQMMPEGVPQQ